MRKSDAVWALMLETVQLHGERQSANADVTKAAGRVREAEAALARAEKEFDEATARHATRARAVKALLEADGVHAATRAAWWRDAEAQVRDDKKESAA